MDRDLHADWARLSPLLDELLPLAAPARQARLQALAAEDAALAAQLAELLARDAALSGAGFLAAPALPGLAQLQALPATLAAPLAAGDSVGHYTLVRPLGEGGMGSVWLARRSDGRYEADVAIKFLRPELMGLSGLAAPALAERFAREGAILARLAHPHIARLLDAGVARDGAWPYLVIEHVPGLPIDRWCAEQALDTPARVRLLLDVLAAVAHAHTRLILHRDIKPSNILVTGDGRALLLDFGIAKLLTPDSGGAQAALTQQAGAVYTPHCAAPEQLRQEEATTATDVYALGVLLYGLLGGGHPTTPPNADPAQRLRTVLEVTPRRLSEVLHHDTSRPPAERRRLARLLRGDLDTIVARALKKDPAERYPDAAALADDLQRWLAHQPIRARPDSRWYVAGRFLRRHRLAVAAGTLATLALATAVGSALREGQAARRQRDRAEGLIEFLLGDLRTRLQPVGRLDVLDAVGERVLQHYAADPPESLDADALGRRARALQLLGEVADNQGRPADAARLWQRAADSTAARLAQAPHDPQRLFEHAQSEFWLGNLARQSGQRDTAALHLDRYLALSRQLVQLQPAHGPWLDELAYAQGNLGIVRLDAGALGEARTLFEAAVQRHQSQLAQRPGARADLVLLLGWLGDSLERAGDLAAARQVQQRRTAVLAQTPALAQDMQAQRLLADSHTKLGLLALAQGEVAAAEAAFGDADAAYQVLLARDPSSLDLLGRRALLHTARGNAAWARGDVAALRAHADAAAAVLPRLLAADPRKLHWQGVLRGSIALLHDQLATLSHGPAPEDELRAALAALHDLQAQGARLDGRQRWLAAELALAWGDRLQQHGRSDEARRQWREALAQLGPPADDLHPRSSTARAAAQLRLGEVQAARALADKVQATGFRHPVAADLHRRLAALP